MKKSRSLQKFLWILGLCVLMTLGTALGQEPVETKAVQDVKIESEVQSATDSLARMLETHVGLTRQLQARKAELKKAATPDLKDEISADISRLQESIGALEKNFEKISTGIDLDRFDTVKEPEFDWKREILDLLSPIIQQLKSMTDRPRQLEKLRSELAYYQSRMPIAKTAVANIQNLISQTEDAQLKAQLNKLKEKWLKRSDQINNQLTVVQYQLEQKSREKKSFWETGQMLVQSFFKSRGRNFILATASFVLTWILFRLAYRLIVRIRPQRRIEHPPIYTRLFDIGYRLLTVIGAVAAFLFVLYIAGDWVLLSLFIIFLLGFAWAAKQNVPRFWQEIRLMINLGPVRENERIVHDGIPWRVVSLNFYSQLENPLLKGGRLRIPLNEFVDKTSRPFGPDEPWFPCREKDWVILSDNTRGQVMTQTPESVQLLLYGGSVKTYSTGDFLSQNPTNISSGFSLKSTFGIDYKHQAQCTQEIPEQLKQMLQRELVKAGYGDNLAAVNAEFSQASASSLDIDIIAVFSGNAAKDYVALTRALQSIAVDACNRYGWEIPFAQVTVHPAGSWAGKTLEPEAG